ncbi:MAG TPA: hypothetical protein VJ738_10790 [Steroidobacteraceae bacterium]|nr:hypothetical protein [Steroidobacteraceae bacterium]
MAISRGADVILPARTDIFAKAIASATICTVSMLGVRQAQAQNAEYPRMAPIERYLMDRKVEIALARSAAPASVSKDATVLVLGRHGYRIAIKGSNGFVCMVSRALVGAFDWPEHWNPKIRGAECLNAPAARAILPIAEMRTALAFAGDSVAEIMSKIRASLDRGAIPALGPGAMSYMMAQGSYLTDEGDHNMPHVMFYVPIADPSAWGADRPGSPVGYGPFWFVTKRMSARYEGLPPIYVFTVSVPYWSDARPFNGAL